jgi:hypothetical protein
MELLYKDLTGKIIGAAMEVHRELGCGFFGGDLSGSFRA